MNLLKLIDSLKFSKNRLKRIKKIRLLIKKINNKQKINQIYSK